MKNIFIIHGAYGNPTENWIPWLKNELEKSDYKVFVPKFPTPENQTLENWNNVFSEYKNHINSETIFIGHSLAPAFILSIVEKLKTPISACFFISGFLEKLNNSTFDTINKSFIDKDFNWEMINQNCKNYFVYHSDNDPYVPIECANNLANKLKVTPIIISQAGHFNESSGYTKFEKLLEDIKENF